MKVKIKKLNPNAKMPTQGTDGAAGFDLYATKGTMLVRGYPQKVPTGLAFEIPLDMSGSCTAAPARQ